MTLQSTQDLLGIIVDKYKSLEQPDFSFLEKTTSSRPCDSLVKEMQNLFDVEEITDINDDVSFRYLLSKFEDQWVVELSMLGLYAVVLRVEKGGSTKLVTMAKSKQEEKIISLLTRHKFEILQRRLLEQRLALKLFNAEPENTCFYQALFSDTDTLPWRG